LNSKGAAHAALKMNCTQYLFAEASCAMPADQSEHLISDAFRHLNAANKELPAKLPAFSEHGLWAAWAALLLVAAFLTGVAWLVIDSDREAETFV